MPRMKVFEYTIKLRVSFNALFMEGDCNGVFRLQKFDPWKKLFVLLSDGTVILIDSEASPIQLLIRFMGGASLYRRDEAEGNDQSDTVTLRGPFSWLAVVDTLNVLEEKVVNDKEV